LTPTGLGRAVTNEYVGIVVAALAAGITKNRTDDDSKRTINATAYIGGGFFERLFTLKIIFRDCIKYHAPKVDAN
jgi:azurin